MILPLQPRLTSLSAPLCHPSQVVGDCRPVPVYKFIPRASFLPFLLKNAASTSF